MFNANNFFNKILIIPILNLLIAVYKFLVMFRIPGALGFSLIILTVLIRLLLQPLMKTQLENTVKINKLKPELDKINQLYKNDRQRLQQEQLKLYQKEGINPAAGCLPLLLQMPILIALYNLFFQLLNAKDTTQVVASINKVVYFSSLKISNLDLSFFGANLAHRPSEWQKYGVFLLIIPVITAALQYWQSKLMTLPNKSVADEVKKTQIEKTKDNQNDKGKEEDMSQMMQKQMSIMMPLMIGFFSFQFPLGLSLYWNTFTIFGIIQQQQINKKYSK